MSLTEKRASRRFDLHLPVSVSLPNTENVEALTRDISHRGLCFVLQKPLQLGSDVELTITLPAEVTLMAPVRVRCSARVVRVESAASSMDIAVAATIENYEFLSPEDSSRSEAPAEPAAE
jgi:hypothetical protein